MGQDYKTINAYIREAEKLRSVALGILIAAAWHSLARVFSRSIHWVKESCLPVQLKH